jgi:uncharacterized protein (TIGR03435 family)
MITKRVAGSIAVFSLTVLLTGVLRAQAPAREEFEVASIKASGTDDGRTLVQVLPGGGLRTSGATLKFLVTFAYDVASFNVSGGPGWINSERFDILAKAERSGSEDPNYDPRKITERQYQTFREQMRPKLRTLLADRFQLKLHREMREESIYALVIAKNGTGLKPSKDFRGFSVGRGQVTANGATVEMLRGYLAGQLGRPVLDRTGLSGAFDFKMEWMPDVAQADAVTPGDPTGPSLFTALQEQLGLKLESTKGPVEVLVIDQVEKPSEN